MAYEDAKLANSAFVSGAMVSGATTLCITASGVNWPINASGTFRVLVDKELLILQGAIGPVYNIITEGAENSVVAAHNDLAAVMHVMTPQGVMNFTGGVNDRPGTSYTVGVVDARGLITMSNGSAIALAIPQATTELSGFGNHFWFGLVNGGLGLLTATPTTSLINGAATFTLRRNQHAVVFSDGTNYAAHIVGENAFVTSGSFASGQVNWTTLSSGTARSGHIANDAVTSGNIASGQLGWPHTASGFVRSGGIADAAVNSGNLASGIGGLFFLASGAVVSGQIGNGAVVSGGVASGQLSWVHLASGAVRSGNVANDAVNSGNVSSGIIFQFHLASGAANSGHVASGAIIGAAGGGARNVASGTLGTNDYGSGSVISGTIASGVVGFGHLANASVQSGTIASGIIGTVHLADASVTSGDVASGSISWPHLASGAVRSGHIANDAVNSGNIASGAVGHMQIADDAIQSGNVQSGRLFSFHLQSGTIFDGPGIGVTIYKSGITIQNLSGAGASFTSGIVVSGLIGNNAVNSGNLSSGVVGWPHFTSPAAFSGHLGSGSVMGQAGGGFFNIASGSIGTFDIASGAIISGRIASGVVGFGHLANGAAQSGTYLAASIASGHIHSSYTSNITASVSQDWELVATATPSSAATVDFTGLNSTYIAYKVVWCNILAQTDGAVFYFRTSTDGGATYDAGASDYGWVQAFNTGGLSGASDTADSELELTGPTGNVGNGEFCTGEILILNASAALYTNVIWSLNYVSQADNFQSVYGSGRRLANADVDAIRFLFSTGNITSGEFRVYGLRAA